MKKSIFPCSFSNSLVVTMTGDSLMPDSEHSSADTSPIDPDEFLYDYPARFYEEKDAYVFWDVQDYPIPDENFAETLFDNIKRTLVNKGCAKVSIYAYVNNKSRLSGELLHKYEKAQITIRDLTEGDIKGNWRMLLDIYMCSVTSDDHANLFVLSKQLLENEGMSSCLEGLYYDKFGVFLSKTGRGLELPSESSSSFLTNLFKKRGRRSAVTLESQSLVPTNSFSIRSVSNSLFNSFGVLPTPESIYCSADTFVYLVLESGSTLASNCTYHFKNRLEIALCEKGYLGSLAFKGHLFADGGLDSGCYYFDHGIVISIGAEFYQPLENILSMAIRYRQKPSNMLILSNFKTFEDLPELDQVCKCLIEKKFNVVRARIDQVITLENQCECPLLYSELEAE